MAREKQEPDIHRVVSKYEHAKGSFQKAKISEHNKSLCLEFVNDLEIGWAGAKKIGKLRSMKYFQVLRQLTEMLESLDSSLTWSYIQKKHTKQLLFMFDNREGWDAWSVHGARVILKKFVTWFRKEHGYPMDYPESDRLNAFMPMIKHPVEVDFISPKPRKLKPIDEIPTAEEVDKLISVWDYYRERERKIEVAARNQALIAVIAEVGVRIGGIGNRKIKDVVFDELGAKVAVVDKTMHGEPIRLITSAPYLKTWRNLHPWKNNPDAPLFPTIDYVRPQYNGVRMSYNSLQYVLKRSRELYNEYAKEHGLPLITRRLHFHAFRYFAQTKDMLAGMPISVQCAQRGWSPSSDRPQIYARISPDQVDKWLIEHQGANNSKQP